MRSMTFSASRGQKAMPTLAVRNTSCWFSWNGRQISVRSDFASCAIGPRLSPSAESTSTKIANSSPARREHREDAAPEQLLFAVSEQLAGGEVRLFDDPVGRGDEHAVGHAVEDTVEVVLVDGLLPRPPPHALEGLLQFRERSGSPSLG